jgi:hypothetical protein
MSNIGSIGFTYVNGTIIADFNIVYERNVLSSNVEYTSNLTENIDAIY